MLRLEPAIDAGLPQRRAAAGPRHAGGPPLTAFDVAARPRLEEVQDDEGEASPLFGSRSGGRRGSSSRALPLARSPPHGVAATATTTGAAPHAEAMLCSPHLSALGLTPPDVAHLGLGGSAARHGTGVGSPLRERSLLAGQPLRRPEPTGHGHVPRRAGPGAAQSPPRQLPRQLSGHSLVRWPSGRSLVDQRVPSTRALLHDGAGPQSPVLLAEGAIGPHAAAAGTAALESIALPSQAAALPRAAAARRRSFVASAPHGGVAIIPMHVLARAGLVHLDSAHEFMEDV